MTWINGKFKELQYDAKVYLRPSKHGINGSRVSKLTIHAPVYKYDRGLDTNLIGDDVVKQVLDHIEHETRWQKLFLEVVEFFEPRYWLVHSLRLAVWFCMAAARVLLAALFVLWGMHYVQSIVVTDNHVSVVLGVWLGLKIVEYILDVIVQEMSHD